MIKKRHIFYIVYALVTIGCMISALVLTPMARQNGFRTISPSPEGDIMLMITAVLIAAAIIFLIVRKICMRIRKADKKRNCTADRSENNSKMYI